MMTWRLLLAWWPLRSCSKRIVCRRGVLWRVLLSLRGHIAVFLGRRLVTCSRVGVLRSGVVVLGMAGLRRSIDGPMCIRMAIGGLWATGSRAWG